jgi:hypothetical protein
MEEYKKFKAKLDACRGETVKITVGNQKGSSIDNVVWFEEHDMWYSPGDIWWNGFGVGKPKKSAATVCQINFPEWGIDRNSGGAFAEDDDGRVFVVHRGKIGGGRKGVGKTGFMKSYKGEFAEVTDGNRVTRVIPVTSTDCKSFLRELSHFVREVARYKDEATAGRRPRKTTPRKKAG